MFQQARKYIEERMAVRPRIAIVLGSGLGSMAYRLENAVVIPYSDIPGWPRSTAIGHAGQLIIGSLQGVDLLVQSGRSHLYEGYSGARVTFPTRVMKLLGIESLVLTNAAGGINLDYQRGALVLIKDHINLMGSNPLAGPNEDDFGPRFPDMSEIYSAEYRRIALEAASEAGIELHEGVYAALLGPSYETPAEIRYLRSIGADIVGMSTVPEAIVASHQAMRVLGISCVTNMAAGILPQKINHEEVLETGRMVRDTFIRLLSLVLPRLQ